MKKLEVQKVSKNGVVIMKLRHRGNGVLPYLYRYDPLGFRKKAYSKHIDLNVYHFMYEDLEDVRKQYDLTLNQLIIMLISQQLYGDVVRYRIPGCEKKNPINKSQVNKEGKKKVQKAISYIQGELSFG
ncbi:hypothetical protein [Shimazuella alba]|uniref:Uncharacterized protein n=1 Tax=Shimazuella alba TaxID=2690964 RepID=A0A6I4VXJ3_9BACL|nr:hypothetical protein [Shimazuella alba]MXQ55298.1 hypothetical protein [Shimazuella alba]